MQPYIKCQGKSATHFVYFWSCKTLPYTHLEATSYIPQQSQSLHIWTTSLSTRDCYKNKYTIQFLWMACISRFAVAISSSETELALGTIRVNIIFSLSYVFTHSENFKVHYLKNHCSEHTYSDHSWRCLPQPGTKRRGEGILRMEDAGTSEEDGIGSQDSDTPIDHGHLARNCSIKIITPAVKASVISSV